MLLLGIITRLYIGMVDNRQSARTTRASVTPIRLSPSSGVPKLVLNFALGRRDQATTDVFIEGLRQATTPQRFQISTDGFQPYVSAITTTLSDRCDSTMRMQIRRLTRLTNAGAPPWHHFGTRQMQLRKARLPPGLSLHTSYAESAFPVQRIHFGGCGMLHSREPRTQDHSVVRRIDDCRGWDLSPLATGSAVWKFIDGAPIRLWLAPSTAPAALDTCLRDEPCRTSRWRRNPQADETSIRSPVYEPEPGWKIELDWIRLSVEWIVICVLTAACYASWPRRKRVTTSRD